MSEIALKVKRLILSLRMIYTHNHSFISIVEIWLVLNFDHAHGFFLGV